MVEIFAYGDETGDRGLGEKTSPVFAMATVLGQHYAMVGLQEAVLQLRKDFSVPEKAVMSAKKHVKTYERKLHAANVLSSVPDITVIYVLSMKSELIPGSFKNGEKDFFDFVSARAYRSTLWAARNSGGNSVRVRFGHVIGMDQTRTKQFIRQDTDHDPKVPTYLEKELSWVSADKYLESQAADLYAAFLKDAFWPDQYGNTHERHLLQIWPQIRKGWHGCVVPLGLFTMPKYEVLTARPWFLCRCPNGH